MARGKAKGKDRHGPGRLEDPEGGGEAWLTTYADAITLLMAFFMMLYAMSQIDQVKFLGLIAGFAEPFGNDAIGANSGKDNILPAGAGIVGDRTTGQPGLASGPRDNPTAEVTLDPMHELMQSLENPVVSSAEPLPLPEVDADGVPYLDLNQLAEVRNAIEEELAAQGFADAVVQELTTRGLVVSIAADDILFASGSAVMRDEGRQIIARIAPVVADFANEIRVEGHTDDQPLNRAGYSNWNLSTDRAIAIVDGLIDDHGIDPDRLSATGFGEFRPVAPNDTPENRARNRRVEIVILAGGS